MLLFKKKFEDSKRLSESVNRWRTESTKVKRERTKIQTLQNTKTEN